MAIQIEDDANRFFWTYTEEPHKTRRLEIIKAHPEVGSEVVQHSIYPTDTL